MTIKELANIPWRRVYTFNVDNCFEESVIESAKAFGVGDHRVEVLNFSDDFVDFSPQNSQSIVHLHGNVARNVDGYVFSRNEYAKLMARANAWMLTLTQLMKVEPFIVAGTTLDEVDVEYYLEQRTQTTARSDVAPSILVEPFPDLLTRRLCENHEFCLFEGTAVEFANFFRDKFGPPPGLWAQSFDSHLESLSLSKREKILFSATFEAAPKVVDADTNISPFLLGSRLSWGHFRAGADIPRDITPGLTSEIQKFATDPEYRVFLLLDHPASGRSVMLRRVCYNLARQEKNVFWFTGQELIEPETASAIIEKISGRCFIFVDNWADSSSFFLSILGFLKRSDIIFVGSERIYRKPYIEDSLSEENIAIVESQMDLTRNEARKLILKFQGEGLTSEGNLTDRRIKEFSAKLDKEVIGIAACRIQNSYNSFDAIVDEMISTCSTEWIRAYVGVGISRYCYAGGVGRSVLLDACPGARLDKMADIYSALPVASHPNDRQSLVPARASVADRVIAVLQKKDPQLLAEVFANLANALAPRVNREQIRKRAPAAKLAGGLLDFDRVVRRFINDKGEYFYDEVKELWSWNSRYWEQRALLKLDRYLSDRSDRGLMMEAIQNARFAYSIERHPLSLATLAKMLFAAMETEDGNIQSKFDEAWSLIVESIDLESKWQNIKATAFMVCFRGVISYANRGGILSGDQSDKLRDIISITYQRNLRDPRLIRTRDELLTHI